MDAEWSRAKEYWRELFGGRSTGWWIGGVIGFLVFVVVTARLQIDARRSGIVAVLVGGAAGNWTWHKIQESLAADGSRAAIAHGMLAVGVLLFVVNILPEYHQNLFGSGGGYVWTTMSSVLAGLGAAVGVLGFLMRGSSSR
jgi:hypothetical protein